jgi:hypothetical protein
VIPLDSYLKWSDLMNTFFSGYEINEKNNFIRTTAPTINYKGLISMLSKNYDPLIESAKPEELTNFENLLNVNGPMFLDEKSAVNKVMYSSFPRSGSTFFRKYLESITGVPTGSPYSNKIMANFALCVLGLKGEGHHKDDETWFVKSHFPV